MNGLQTALVIGVFVIADLVVIPLIIAGIVSTTWGGLEKRFPARPPAGDAVRREFQSLRIGTANFGGCVHLAVDAECLHLLPAKFIRWFGAGPVSIPWESVEDVRFSRSGKHATARAGTTKLLAPAWAMKLADAGGVEGADDE